MGNPGNLAPELSASSRDMNYQGRYYRGTTDSLFEKEEK